MKKNLLVLVYALCICSLTFAQTDDNQKVIEGNKDFMERLKKVVVDPNTFVKTLKNEEKKQVQFVLTEKVAKDVIKVKKAKNINLGLTCAYIDVQPSAIVQFDWNRTGNVIKENGKEIIKKDKVETKDNKNFAVYKVINNVHSVFKNNNTISDVKYEVTLHWNVKKDSAKVTLSSIEKKEVPYFGSELATMSATAKKLITDWYKDPVSYFEGKIGNDEMKSFKLIDETGKDVDADKIAVFVSAPKNNETKISGNNLPDVKVYVDPKNYMKPDTNIEDYDDPEAYYTFSEPTFTVKFKDDFKDADLSVDFNKKKEPKQLEPREVVAEKKANATYDLANLTMDFTSKLKAYLENTGDKKAKEELMSLFDEKCKIEVAIVSKTGKIKTESRTTDKYLTGVNGTNIKIESVGTPEFIDKNDPDRATIAFTQKHVNDKKNYCDTTDKIMVIQKNDNGDYKITSIKVAEDENTKAKKVSRCE